MRITPLLALAGALMTAGCAYWPTDPSPIRLTESPAEVSSCRRIAPVGMTRTDGVKFYGFADTFDLPPGVSERRARRGPPGNQFDERLAVLKTEALKLGATDLLLVRRIKRDWSYVEAVAYLCRR